METNEQIKAPKDQDKKVVPNQKVVQGAAEGVVKSNNKTLTPYQKYKNSKNKNGKKYFEFYNDVKVYTHNIWDW